MDAMDDLRAHMYMRFDRLQTTIDREFARQRRILTDLAVLTIVAIVISGILDR